jgi:hypothetical protein
MGRIAHATGPPALPVPQLLHASGDPVEFLSPYFLQLKNKAARSEVSLAVQSVRMSLLIWEVGAGVLLIQPGKPAYQKVKPFQYFRAECSEL